MGLFDNSVSKISMKLLVLTAALTLPTPALAQCFNTQQVITTAADGAESVYATDLDGDGDADVLSASAGDNKIAWYENLGSGSFGPQQVITTAANGAQSVYATDLDGDNDADVLSASWIDDKIAWYENLMVSDFNVNYCIAAPNSASASGAQISASGSSDVGLNDLVLTAGPIQPGEFGVYFHGGAQIQLPFGEGFLCTGGGVVRIWPPSPADGTGFVTRALDNTGPGGVNILQGATRYFQFWYRDPLGGDVNGDMVSDGFSLSDGLEICFY